MENRRIASNLDLNSLLLTRDMLQTPRDRRLTLHSANISRNGALTSRNSSEFKNRFVKCQSLSKLDDPATENQDSFQVFPKWLLERNDFQNCLASSWYDFDIGKICSKPFQLRNSAENRELFTWCKSCSFFKTLSDFSLAEMCEKLSTVNFSSGEVLLNEGEIGDRVYIIVKGSAGVYYSSSSVCKDIVGSGNIIGEKALESNQPRNATIKAIEPITVLLLKKDDYMKIVMRQRHKQRNIIVSFLKNTPFFQNLLSAKLEVIAWSMITLQYTNNHTIYNIGQLPIGIYFIKEGTVNLDLAVTLTNCSKIPNKKREILVEKKTYEKVVRVCKKGDFFGEEELLESSERKCRAICMENCEIFLLRKEFLYENFVEKERKQLMEVNQKLPDVEVVKKMVQQTLRNKRIKIKAMRDTIRPDSYRKSIACTIGSRSLKGNMKPTTQKKKLDHFLVRKETFFDSQ